MQRVAAMTVIRGEGGCEAIMIKVVSQEVRRLQEKQRKEKADLMEWSSFMTRRRNNLLGERRSMVRVKPKRRKGFLARAWEKVYNAHCIFWAMCIEFGLLEEIRDGGDEA